MRTRAMFLVVHRWIGLGLGFFFAVACLTGSALLFQPELERLFTRGLYPVTPGDVGVAAIEATLAMEFPDAELRILRWSDSPTHDYRATLHADGRERTVVLDPGTGEVVEPSRMSLPILLAIRRLHTSLGAGRPGSHVVAAATALGGISLVTGLILWWPGIRRLARGFRIRRGRTFYILNYDVHQVAGMLALPGLLFATITGVLLGYPALGIAISNWRGADTQPWADVRVERQEGDSARVSLAQLERSARAAVPDGRPAIAVLPEAIDEPAEIFMRVGPTSIVTTTVVVMLDRHDGRVLQLRDPRRPADAARRASGGYVRLHVGSVAGTGLRLAYSVSCAIGGLLFLSGGIMWWLKRKRGEGVERLHRERLAE